MVDHILTMALGEPAGKSSTISPPRLPPGTRSAVSIRTIAVSFGAQTKTMLDGNQQPKFAEGVNI